MVDRDKRIGEGWWHGAVLPYWCLIIILCKIITFTFSSNVAVLPYWCNNLTKIMTYFSLKTKTKLSLSDNSMWYGAVLH